MDGAWRYVIVTSYIKEIAPSRTTQIHFDFSFSGRAAGTAGNHEAGYAPHAREHDYSSSVMTTSFINLLQ
jgi:hypothetical protein